MGRGSKALGEIGDVGFEFGDQALFELALVAETERIEPRSAKELEPGHDPERRHRPRAGFALLHSPGRRIGTRERPGADMEMQPIRAFEFARQRLLKRRRREQARDFPFILGREQLVIGARGRCG